MPSPVFTGDPPRPLFIPGGGSVVPALADDPCDCCEPGCNCPSGEGGPIRRIGTVAVDQYAECSARGTVIWDDGIDVIDWVWLPPAGGGVYGENQSTVEYIFNPLAPGNCGVFIARATYRVPVDPLECNGQEFLTCFGYAWACFSCCAEGGCRTLTEAEVNAGQVGWCSPPNPNCDLPTAYLWEASPGSPLQFPCQLCEIVQRLIIPRTSVDEFSCRATYDTDFIQWRDSCNGVLIDYEFAASVFAGPCETVVRYIIRTTIVNCQTQFCTEEYSLGWPGTTTQFSPLRSRSREVHAIEGQPQPGFTLRTFFLAGPSSTICWSLATRQTGQFTPGRLDVTPIY